MKFQKIQPYKAACIVSDEDMKKYDITADDIFERTEKGYQFIRSVRSLTIESIKEEWPGCAFSMQITAYQNGDIALIFSETIEDFIYNLKQSRNMMESNTILDQLILKLESSNEEEARRLIRQFEKNIAAMR